MLLHCVFLNYLAFRITAAHKCSVVRWLFSPLRAFDILGLHPTIPHSSLEIQHSFSPSFNCLYKCSLMYLLSVHCNQIQYDSTQSKPLLNRALAYIHSISFFVFTYSLSLSLFCPSLTLAHAKQKPQDTSTWKKEMS